MYTDSSYTAHCMKGFVHKLKVTCTKDNSVREKRKKERDRYTDRQRLNVLTVSTTFLHLYIRKKLLPYTGFLCTHAYTEEYNCKSENMVVHKLNAFF